MVVSVLMGVYHRGKDTQDLKNAVESILNQSYSNFEFLICPCGSSPQAVELLKQYAALDPRIRLVKDTGNHSLAAKLNCCLREATGKYLARMDDDDISLPQRLEKQLAFLQSHQEFAFAGCNITLFCGGSQTGLRSFPQRPKPEDFFFTMPYIHPTLMFRREALTAAGGYSQSTWAELCEDYDLLLRLYALGFQGANLQEPLFLYQVRPDDYKKRKYRHRVNEAVTRFCRYNQLGLLPCGLPYVLKPLIVGLLPHRLTESLKKHKR